MTRQVYCRAGATQPCVWPHCGCRKKGGDSLQGKETEALIALLCFVGFAVVLIVATAFHYFG